MNRATGKKEHMLISLNNVYDCLEEAQIKINELMYQEPEYSTECDEYRESEDNFYNSTYFTLYEFSEQIEYMKLYVQDLIERKGK